MANYAAELEQTFRALAHPVRRAVVARLSTHPTATVKALAEPFAIGMPTFLKHLAVLEEGGLVTSTKSGRVRTCSLQPERLTDVEQWLTKRRQDARAALDRFAHYVEALEEKRNTKMNSPESMKHGTLTLTRKIKATRELVFEAWTQLEHRRHWFKGPDWTEIERQQDLRVGGTELARGRFANGLETIYTARYHLIERNHRLVYAFDMHVGGEHFSVSLAGAEFHDAPDGTAFTYTEQGFFFADGYDESSRLEGTKFLLERFTDYVVSLSD